MNKVRCSQSNLFVWAILTYPSTLIAYLLKCVKKRQIALDFASFWQRAGWARTLCTFFLQDFFARTRIFHPNILIGQNITRRSRRVGFVQKSKMHQTWNQSILIGRTTSRRNWCVQAGTSTGHQDKPHPWISWESWGRTRRVGLG